MNIVRGCTLVMGCAIAGNGVGYFITNYCIKRDNVNFVLGMFFGTIIGGSVGNRCKQMREVNMFLLRNILMMD